MRRLPLVVGLLAACGTSSIRARWTHVEDAARIDRVELYVSIQHDARVGVMFRSFETRMLARLEACHVRTTIIHGRPRRRRAAEHGAAADGGGRDHLRRVMASAQQTHIHEIVEATDPAALVREPTMFQISGAGTIV